MKRRRNYVKRKVKRLKQQNNQNGDINTVSPTYAYTSVLSPKFPALFSFASSSLSFSHSLSVQPSRPSTRKRSQAQTKIIHVNQDVKLTVETIPEATNPMEVDEDPRTVFRQPRRLVAPDRPIVSEPGNGQSPFMARAKLEPIQEEDE